MTILLLFRVSASTRRRECSPPARAHSAQCFSCLWPQPPSSLRERRPLSRQLPLGAWGIPLSQGCRIQPTSLPKPCHYRRRPSSSQHRRLPRKRKVVFPLRQTLGPSRSPLET